MVELGTTAPPFRLATCNPSVDEVEGSYRSLNDFVNARAVVIMFICNHCPFVKHVQSEMVRMAQDYSMTGVQFIAINSNDAAAYPADSFDAMTAAAKRLGYPFPYLYDETQEVARAYGAECTPDFFVHDSLRRLVYRGRLDSSRPGQGESNGSDLRTALDELLATGLVGLEQHPSLGCNIKWKPEAAGR
jgi:thiol-disulfide isomerase/thioredoxin